ncbi:MAG: ATP-binding protein, partial [Nocardioides sp.]
RSRAGKERRGGTGLGLAIVSALVEAHRGTVTCSSDVERGTTFTVRIPSYRQES